MLLVFPYYCISSSYLSAKATTATVANSPGYVDEFYKSMVTGAMAVGAVAVNQGQWFTDNVAAVKDTAVATLNEMTPSMKENLKTSMSQLGDGTVTLGNAITNFLDSFKSKVDMGYPTGLSSFDKNVLTLNKGAYFIFNNSTAGLTYRTSQVRLYFSGGTVELMNDGGGSSSVIIRSSLPSVYNSLLSLSNGGAVTPSSLMVLFTGNAMTMKVYNSSDTLLNDSSDIYNHLDNFLRDHTVPQLKDAGIVLPNVDRLVTGTNTRIDVNPYNGEMSLDGVGYNGDFEWSTSTKLGVNTPVPIPSVNGTDLVFNPSSGAVYNPDGSIVNDLSNVTWRTPDIVLQKDAVTGLTIPTITTITGALVNILTGEIISNPPKKPDKTNPKTKKTGKFQDIIPIALLMVLLDLIRAIIYYLIRLFNYIATMPFIPAQSINNPTFDWFVNTKFLGIYPFKMAMNFASFCFAFVVYKVIRRNF